ncbi:hypothetical protein [Paenibacillus sambharensis]|uniref:hypothetical protein n=1 Tax=Paenibacillus sambharensis TaxID=1803190 RepID=UPI0015E8EA0E|nr:hypothetical protein [Paenibacillus sambharensis]
MSVEIAISNVMAEYGVDREGAIKMIEFYMIYSPKKQKGTAATEPQEKTLCNDDNTW